MTSENIVILERAVQRAVDFCEAIPEAQYVKDRALVNLADLVREALRRSFAIEGGLTASMGVFDAGWF